MRVLALVAMTACVGADSYGTNLGTEMREGREEPTVTSVQVGAIASGTLLKVTVDNANSDVLEWNFEGEDLELLDDGQGDDARAGDGVYVGVATTSLDPILTARTDWTDKASGTDLWAHSFNGLAWNQQDTVDPEVLNASEALEEFSLSGPVTLTTLFPAATTSSGASVPLPSVTNPENTLIVTEPHTVYNPDHTGVWQMVNGTCKQVGNPDGIWGFRYLMNEAGMHPPDIDEWLSNWLNSLHQPKTINGIAVPTINDGLYDLNMGSQMLPGSVPWPKNVDNPGWDQDVFNWEQAPLQLIAIVNRVDLAASGYGGKGTAELRFIFTFIHEETCEPAPGNIILEYEVPGDLCSLQGYANDWWHLDNFQVGTDVYNDHLMQLTKPVTEAFANPQRPNESNLKFLRTNEQVLRWPHYPSDFPNVDGFFWEFQQFELVGPNGELANTLLGGTPSPMWVDQYGNFNTGSSQDIDDYIDSHAADIVNFDHQILANWGNTPLQSPYANYGKVQTSHAGPFNTGNGSPFQTQRGNVVGTDNTNDIVARQTFSLGTCNGCHHAETFEDTDGTGAFRDLHPGASTPGGQLEEAFRHVRPTSLGAPAALSRFLTGTQTSCAQGSEFVDPLGPLAQCNSNTCCPIGDPAFGYDKGQVHYNEIARRGQILDTLVTQGCGAVQAAPGNEVILAAH